MSAPLTELRELAQARRGAAGSAAHRGASTHEQEALWAIVQALVEVADRLPPPHGASREVVEQWVSRIDTANGEVSSNVLKALRSQMPLSWLEEYDMGIVVPALRAVAHHPEIVAALVQLSEKYAQGREVAP